MVPIIAFAIFVAIFIVYIQLMKTQGNLKEDERIIYKEDGVKCFFKSLSAISWYTRNIQVTDRRIIEKYAGLFGIVFVHNITLNPSIKDEFGIINVLHADTTKVTIDENSKECLELICKSGNITRHFTIRYYLKDFSKIKEQFR